MTMDPGDERVVDPHRTAFEVHTLDRVLHAVGSITEETTMVRRQKQHKKGAFAHTDGTSISTPPRERSHFAAWARAKVSEHLSNAHTPVLSDVDAKAFRKELLRGEWSLVDQFDREGMRYFTWTRTSGPRAAHRTLTRREKDVLERVAMGHTDRSIAHDLRCSPSTVATHRLRAMSKLGLHSRSVFSQILASVSADGGYPAASD